jgi:hypothetical protein
MILLIQFLQLQEQLTSLSRFQLDHHTKIEGEI